MKYWWIIALWFVAANVSGQKLTAAWSTDSCMIGEQVTLKIRLENAPKNVEYSQYSGEVPCRVGNGATALTEEGSLEIIGRFTDSTWKKNGKNYWEGTYLLTAWDTGVYLFPPPTIVVNDSSYTVVPKRLVVSFVKKKVNADIDEVPVEIEFDFWRWLKKYWWAFAFPLFGLGVYIALKKSRRKKALRGKSLKERSLIYLEELRKKALWRSGKINEHYIEFSTLLRSYLSGRYEVNLMERTTHETLLLLRAKGLQKDTLERIRRLLAESDMVKFAKGIPDEESILLSLSYLEQLIVELSPLELNE
jgi:hypothetical protein